MSFNKLSNATSPNGEFADSELLAALRLRLRNSAEHLARLSAVADGDAAIHLAIMHEPYLTYIVQGRKTIESRFSVNRVAPYGYVECGDILLFRKIGGFVCTVAIVDRVNQFRLDERSWSTIYEQYARDICATDDFFAERSTASYATLMRLTGTATIEPIDVPKHDRRGWVVLIERCTQLSLL